MADDRISVAIARIERAVEGIERWTATPRPEAPAGVDPMAHAALEQRHAALRSEAEVALGAIDALLAAAAAPAGEDDHG
ncbi:hypothetical protein [Sphingomonas sanxanigenens]|uniref:Uncharacterized protein n=1 Tax=Sphingomonas sanxanigenens DSM 19645 = NX02 TaxID=1123269 RepID=W0AES9_9SPHN|nr:hypothetical protein [Sphingomonas sanxanigenens]AHE56414.1 hypothetical protein NX02_24030 [Sphingomonas sanxanigenens DSM 19645 = NX02]